MATAHPLLYEINTRCWLADLSERAGRRLTLAEVPDSEFDEWQRCGFTHIWLMGVWTLGARGRAWSRRCHRDALALRGRDVAGSPYAVCGYTVSRKLGGEGALAKFRQNLNRHGIALMLDFVPNHTALDHPWVSAHPEYYVTSPEPREGTIKPYRDAPRWFAHGHCGHGTPWIDTLQLDYRRPELRRAVVDELLGVARQCDGVRCDMAMLALNPVFERIWQNFPDVGAASAQEFWPAAISAVRARHSDFTFLAEVYWDLEARLQELGFDYTYDKRLYDRVVAHDAAGAAHYLRSRPPEFLRRSAHFLENHDEPRIASLLSPNEHCAAALLVAALPGLRFFHEGQFQGWRAHANVHFARRLPEMVEERVDQFYRRLFSALAQSVIGRGTGALLTPEPLDPRPDSAQNLVLIEWRADPHGFDLAVVNLSGAPAQCYAIPSFPESAAQQWSIHELLSTDGASSKVEFRDGRCVIDLSAHAGHLWQFRLQTPPAPAGGAGQTSS